MSQDQELIKVTAIVEREFEERSKLFYNQYLLDKQHEVRKVQIREQIRREYPDFPFYIKYVQHVPRPRGYRAANQLHMSQHSGVNQDDVELAKLNPSLESHVFDPVDQIHNTRKRKLELDQSNDIDN